MHFRCIWNRLPVQLLTALWALAIALPAGAVIIDSGDGTGNTSAPTPVDPGWAHVGLLNNLSCVYLRNGWVLTANHVGTGTVTLDGAIYNFVPGTRARLDNGDGTFPDLMVFGIWPIPGLPELPIRSNSNLPNGKVIMIGNGRDRGPATDSDDPAIWQPPPDPPATAIPGWWLSGTATRRWGENEVAGQWAGNPGDTVTNLTVFDHPTDPGHQAHEAQAAVGDSGGAVFAKQGNTWELAGIMLFVGLHEGHINNSVLREEVTGMADLSFYRQQILDLTAVPEPSGSSMLGSGVLLLALLAQRRRRAD